MAKLTGEAGEKRAQQTKLIIEGWNGGLTGGELAATHGLTRSAIMSILGRARGHGAIVQARDRYSAPATAARVKKAQERKPTRPEPPLPSITSRRTSWPQSKTRQFPKPKPLAQKDSRRVAEPSALLVPLMDLQNNAGCRYSEDAKLFCNAPGFPYCSEHKAIVNPPSAQRGGYRKLAKNYGSWR